MIILYIFYDFNICDASLLNWFQGYGPNHRESEETDWANSNNEQTSWAPYQQIGAMR